MKKKELKEKIKGLLSSIKMLKTKKKDKYTIEILEKELSLKRKELNNIIKEEKKSIHEKMPKEINEKYVWLLQLKELMEKNTPTGEQGKDVSKWNEINEKIGEFEDEYYKVGNYYGVGSISIPSDRISYNYCKDTYEDVLTEIKKQIKKLEKKYIKKEKKCSQNKIKN